MKDEIKEIEEWLRDISTPTGLSYSGDRTLSNSMVDHIIDYITNLQEEKENQVHTIKILLEENERLKEIAHKMHLWIFLNSGNEQKIYNEIGLTDEENAILGYSGQYKVGNKDDAINRD